MTMTVRNTLIAGIAVLGLLAMDAAEAQRSRGGSGGGGAVVSGGGFRGHPGRHWHGGAWVGAGRPWGWGPAWRPGWGWGGWGGWGWGVGWNPWAWSPGFWGWSAGVPVVIAAPSSGAWILPPSAQMQWIERPQETAPAAAAGNGGAPEQWWYWCASAQAYYPYVASCDEGWQRVTPQVPAGAR